MGARSAMPVCANMIGVEVVEFSALFAGDHSLDIESEELDRYDWD